MAEHEQIEGGCLCGAVRYRVSAPWLAFLHCHCSRCRRISGTGHASNLFAAPDALAWLAGEARVRRFDLPEARSFASGFCETCGSRVPHKTRGGSAWLIPAGSLDAPPSIAPVARIWWDSRASWSCEDALPRFAERYEP